MTLASCIFAMASPVRTCLNVGVRLLQMAFAGVILAAAITPQHVRSDNEKFKNHPPTLHFVAAVSGLTVAGALFGLSLTWYTCLVKYGRVVDLLDILLNLAAGSVSICHVSIVWQLTYWKLLAVKVKWTKEGCPTQDKHGEMYNGPKAPECGVNSKISWFIGDKCEDMGLRCRLGQVASILCFLIVALLLVTLAFSSFVKRPSGSPAVKVHRAAGDNLAMKRLTCGSERSVQMAMSR